MLRIFMTGPPRTDRADVWVRYAADGRPIAQGRDVPAQRPADAHVEVVLAASEVRLIALALPAMPRSRLHNAARFAVEDQLATAAEESAIAVANARDDGVVAAVTSQALVRAIAAHDRRVARVVPESALAPCGDGWTWCASSDGESFVRRDDASAFAVDGAADHALPGALVAALAQAARSGKAPPAVHVAFECEAARLAQWSRAGGVPFVASANWRWQDATPQAFAAAPDFLDAGDRGDAGADRAALRRAFRPALAIAGAALALHVVALVAQWSWLNVENWRLGRALVEQAKASGLADASTPDAAAAAIGRRNTEVRHRAGQAAPADALPLLARAAPSLGALPSGALRSARYADHAWTLELGKVDAAAVAQLTHALGAAGVDAIAAPTSAGARVRLALAATAR
jgi:general secretion pathway protein L